MVKFLKRFLITGLLVTIVIIAFAEWQVGAYKEQLYTQVDIIPERKVGLLLGTSKYIKKGEVNQYYQNRIEAAAALYKAGKIRFILISGDNATKAYNEPETFKKDLVALGIPADRIVLDYAGFRTLDSVERCKAVFQEDSITIISQEFHNLRALFIADHKNVNAIAFNAKAVGENYGFKTQLRERLARVKAVLDIYILNTKPKFYGEKIEIS